MKRDVENMILITLSLVHLPLKYEETNENVYTVLQLLHTV